jgi:hypothetical protein
MDLWFGDCVCDATSPAGTAVSRVTDQDGYGEGLS